MGQLRVARSSDKAAFPGAAFVVEGTPPITQCEELTQSDSSVDWTIGESVIRNVSQLNQNNVIGKTVEISSSASDDGFHTILGQTDTTLTIDHTFIGSSATVIIDITDAPGQNLTRTPAGFQQFIHNAGKAHTTKGGQLFTDIASAPLAPACSITFDPQ